jgi:hypothetical protein
MANRNYNRHQSLEKEIKSLYADVAIGASGAPTINKALGVESITRDSAGVYILTLQDKYTRLVAVNAVQLVASAQDLNIQLEAEDVDGAKTITLRCVSAGVETDPANGSRLLINIDLKNSSVGE